MWWIGGTRWGEARRDGRKLGSNHPHFRLWQSAVSNRLRYAFNQRHDFDKRGRDFSPPHSFYIIISAFHHEAGGWQGQFKENSTSWMTTAAAARMKRETVDFVAFLCLFYANHFALCARLIAIPPPPSPFFLPSTSRSTCSQSTNQSSLLILIQTLAHSAIATLSMT